MAAAGPIVRQAEIPGRGRGLVAARRISGGEVLVREAPLLIYMDAEAARSKAFCEHCVRSLAAGGGGAGCPSCDTSVFCDSNCLNEAQATSHDTVACRVLRALVDSNPATDFENQARFLIAAYNLRARAPQSFGKVLQLSGGSADGEVEECSSDNAAALHAFIHDNTVEGDGAGLTEFTVDLVRALLIKDERNSFALMAPTKGGVRRVRAYAVYSQASLFNHDCLPNCCRFDYLDAAAAGTSNNTDVVVRALHEVEEGSEVCFSYFPINWPYAERQRRLAEDYGFACTCNRCGIEQHWADEEEDEDGDAGGSSGDEEEEDVEAKVSELRLNGAPDEAEVGGGEDDGRWSSGGGGEPGDEDEDDFPHALFFVKYLCPSADCGGTMAPLDPSSAAAVAVAVAASPNGGMECNMCGEFRSDDALLADMREHGVLR